MTPTISTTPDTRVTMLTGLGRIRKRQEDAYGVSPDGRVLVLADGMGGHQKGDEASKAAVTAALESLSTQWLTTGAALLTACKAAHGAVSALHTGRGREPGSTVVIAIMRDSGTTIAHVGDSRAYRLRDGLLQPLTEDHASFGGLSRCLGAAMDSPLPTITRRTLHKGDRILLCSDGLHGLVSDVEIAAIWRRSPDSATFAQRAYDAAMNAGGHDNVTMVIAEV